MKYFILVLLFSVSAHASVSITCDGREVLAGDTGKRGTLIVVSEPPSDNFAGHLSVGWSDVTSPITGDGRVCGIAIPQGMGCALNNGLATSPYQQTEICGLGGIDTTAQPYRSFDASLVLGPDLDHGFFSCAAHDVGIAMRLELSRCHSTETPAGH